MKIWREMNLKEEIKILKEYQYKMEVEMKQILSSLGNADISDLFQKYVDSVNLNEAKDVEISQLKMQIKQIKSKRRKSKRASSRLEFSLSPTSRSNSESALKLRKRAQSVRSGRCRLDQSFMSNNSDLQDVFGTQMDPYYDVMHLQPSKAIKPVRALPRSASPKKRQRLANLQKQVEEMRSWESKIVDLQTENGKKAVEISNLKSLN